MWCLVSQLLVSATFLEAPARFQSCQPLEPPDGWLCGVGAEGSEMNEEVHHLMVIWVLFQTSVLTLQIAEPRPDSLEGGTNSPGMATGSGKAPEPVPSQVLPQRVEEETDHLLGAPRKETSDREKWRLGRMEAL